MPETYAQAPKNVVFKSVEDREETCRRITELWDNSQEQKGDGPTGWWEEIERMYRCESDQTTQQYKVVQDRISKVQKDKTGIAMFRLPQILHSRANALNAQMATVITRQLRYASVTEGVPSQIARKKEVLIHRLWQDGGFVDAIRKAGITATLLNKGVFRIYPEYGDGYGKRKGVCVEALHPKDVGFGPSGVNREDWSFCAHRKYTRQRRVKDKMRAGEYFDISGTFQVSDPSQHDDTGMYRHAKTCLALQPEENDSRVIQQICGQVRLDLSKKNTNQERTGQEQWYRFVLAYDNKELLSLTPYGYSQPEYFFNHVMPELTVGWGGMSVGRMLYPIQDGVNKIVAVFYEMGMRGAMAPVIGPELASGEKYSELPAGAYVATDEQQQPWSPSVTVQLQPLLEYVVASERWADQVARISQNTLGTIAGRQTTATTDSIIAAGVQVGQEEYLANFTSCFPDMARHTEEIALSMYGDLAEYYEGRIGTDGEEPITPEEIAAECSWEPTGKNPNSTPMAKVQDAMQLVEIAMNAPQFGYDQYELGKVIAENSSLVGIQVQKPREKVQEEMQAAAEAEQAMLERQHEMELEKIRLEAELEEEKAHADAQRQLVTDASKGMVAAASRPTGSTASNGKARTKKK